MRGLSRFVLLATLFGIAAAPSPFRDGDESLGTWRNHSNSVHLRSYHCGDSMCGKVIWASEKAIADAARGGSPNLVGMDLFHDFKLGRDGKWHGKVFVPDINKTFSGTVVLLDPKTLKGTGCVLGGLICKSQTLTRIE